MAKFSNSTPTVVATTLTVTPPVGTTRRVVILAGFTTAATTFSATGMTSVVVPTNVVLPYNEDGWFMGPAGAAVTIAGTGVFNITYS